MADNPISEYQSKLKQLREATQAVERVVKTVINGADNLKYWRDVVVSGGGGFPPHLMGSNRTINADDWPTGQQIGQLLSRWHSVRFETQQAYERIPLSEREGIQPPSE